MADQITATPLRQNLAAYRTPPGWSPGRPWLVQTLWFCGGAPLLAARCLPGSAWRVALLRLFGARIGNGCRLKPGLRVTFPWRLSVGQHCWLGEDAWLDNLAMVTLSDRVCVSQGAYLCTGNHDFRSPGFEQRLGPISVGSDAWIAARAVLAPGTVVSPGAVICLGAVVSGDVPSGAILRGNPAVVVGQRLESP
ncbi:WcaF family extracellular polysaccharide biosynthesis acetyltransferase [Synechococcus sp. CS-1328]|uniref:WcaF family extracellular polysaccharide biosynthesis acetyltransferase n=1 Tax=Synechococcus sp. CS-1328 TaxID=2847976 RepID=UPI00223B0431|nr:WcaF family extracellular polysaccharide biosynthesis acetyltransferase [Synechococcus sp. CS-1328]MCT0225927.1 WcaF family extracellular polysaccharide biosynthesis acetyltransferase [Synechococcus sp. CS-1328]